MTDDNRAKNEIIKENSRLLRGTIAEGLADVVTGAISEDDSQLTKFHGTYLQDDRDVRPERAKKKLEKAYSFMIRVRLPGGVTTSKQWLALDAIAGTYANHTLRLTTRQTFQFHGVIKSNMKRTMQAINAALLDTLAACGDVNRNVLADRQPVSVEGARGGARARRRGQRAPAAADGRLSRDLARRREVSDQSGPAKKEVEPIYGDALSAAQIQDRHRRAAVQRRRYLRARPRLHRHRRERQARRLQRHDRRRHGHDARRARTPSRAPPTCSASARRSRRSTLPRRSSPCSATGATATTASARASSTRSRIAGSTPSAARSRSASATSWASRAPTSSPPPATSSAGRRAPTRSGT